MLLPILSALLTMLPRIAPCLLELALGSWRSRRNKRRFNLLDKFRSSVTGNDQPQIAGADHESYCD
jgi:hypothetical protein